MLKLCKSVEPSEKLNPPFLAPVVGIRPLLSDPFTESRIACATRPVIPIHLMRHSISKHSMLADTIEFFKEEKGKKYFLTL